MDEVTRNVQVQATLENKEHLLKPGMFVNATVILPREDKTIVIPATAISYAPFGDSVFVIEKKHDEKAKQDGLVLRQQFIRTGETRGDFVAVKKGLKAGEQVVSTGAFKLRNGASVVIDNTIAPRAELTPTPPEYVVKSFTDIFIRRPVLAIVVNLVILIAGLQAIRTLNVRQYPRSENASVTVTTVYVGASAELVRGFITTPLERAIAAADGIDYLESQSAQGLSTITVAPEAQLRRRQGAGRDQLEGRPGARRPAARGRGPGHQHRVGRHAVRLGLPQLHLRRPPAEPDHRLPGPRRAAAPFRDRAACSAPTSSAAAPSRCASGSSPTGWPR